MTDLERLLYRKLYSKSFYDFYKDFWSAVDPHQYVDGDIVQFLSELFQFMSKKWIGYTKPYVDLSDCGNYTIIDFRDSTKDRLNLNIPPRHSKSMIFNVMGVVWLWSMFPIQAVSISHTGALAKEMNERRWALVNSPRFKEIYPEIVINENTKESISDNRGGQMFSQNRDALTGYGGDIIINDDLTNAMTAHKDMKEMANTWEYYQNTMPSRINNINQSMILNIQQRLGVNDITGRILKNDNLRDQYIFLSLPAIFETNTCLVCPISGRKIFYDKGKGLWSERFGDYSKLKAEAGRISIFNTQYQQKPKSNDESVITEDMIITRNSTECPSIDEAEIVYASHDFPVKDKETSDYLGSVLGYKVGSTLYIKECLEKHMAFPASIAYVQNLDEMYAGIIQIIEDKANGSPILQQLQGDIAGLQAYNPGTASKIMRLENASLWLNSKNVVFVKDTYDKLTSEWQLNKGLQLLIERLLDFPMVEHDDIVDAFDMLVNFVFTDKKYAVYARAFNDKNTIEINEDVNNLYGAVFVNKEGDLWKACNIKCKYGLNTTLIETDEIQFRANIENGIKELKAFAPKESVFIDCSDSESMIGIYNEGLTFERYVVDDFDKSVSDLAFAFAQDRVLISKNCKLTKGDIETFKRAKTKTENDAKYITTKDGLVACLRNAMRYFGV